ncbi:hypothetical protein C8J56DRAFT_951454 [Mycena floridula]|nr:hypothetical protein C8J56DRAFT_951454 [Mycena floridula]
MDSQGHARSDTEATVVSEGSKLKDPVAASPTSLSPVSLGGNTLNGPVTASQDGPIPRIIPPEHTNRTLVLCFDGTGDQFNSNIVAFFSLLKKDDRTTQLVYYQVFLFIHSFLSRLMMDEAIAWNINAHVIGGYEFLMQNYISGDRICIFGFSRGAYTARRYRLQYKMYTRTDDLGWAQSNAFKKTFSVHAEIEFVGVWDTVNSVGLIPKTLPFSTSNTIVHTFRHAVSLDEHRAKFKANLWNRPTEQEQALSVTDQETQKKKHDEMHKKGTASKAHMQRDMERKYSRDSTQPTDVLEVWFAGCHCDIGGGSVDNDVPNTLANIPLRWMIRECFKTNTGIMFESEGLRQIGLNPEALWPKVLPPARIENIPPPAKPSNTHRELSLPNFGAADSSTVVKVRPTEEELELKDALSPIYDQLKLKWFWWLLELLPIKQHYQKGDNSWANYFGWNVGRGRIIPKQKQRGVKVHRSATHEDGSKYIPKATFHPEYVTWVD